MRTLEAIAADIDDAREAVTVAQALLRSLQTERANVLIAAAQAHPHPWMGKALVRTTGHHHRRQRGILCLNTQPVVRWGYKGYQPEPGALYVLSHGGGAAYRFPDAGHGEWSLDA